MNSSTFSTQSGGRTARTEPWATNDEVEEYEWNLDLDIEAELAEQDSREEDPGDWADD